MKDTESSKQEEVWSRIRVEPEATAARSAQTAHGPDGVREVNPSACATCGIVQPWWEHAAKRSLRRWFCGLMFACSRLPHSFTWVQSYSCGLIGCRSGNVHLGSCLNLTS